MTTVAEGARDHPVRTDQQPPTNDTPEQAATYFGAVVGVCCVAGCLLVLGFVAAFVGLFLLFSMLVCTIGGTCFGVFVASLYFLSGAALPPAAILCKLREPLLSALGSHSATARLLDIVQYARSSNSIEHNAGENARDQQGTPWEGVIEQLSSVGKWLIGTIERAGEGCEAQSNMEEVCPGGGGNEETSGLSATFADQQEERENTALEANLGASMEDNSCVPNEMEDWKGETSTPVGRPPPPMKGEELGAADEHTWCPDWGPETKLSSPSSAASDPWEKPVEQFDWGLEEASCTLEESTSRSHEERSNAHGNDEANPQGNEQVRRGSRCVFRQAELDPRELVFVRGICQSVDEWAVVRAFEGFGRVRGVLLQESKHGQQQNAFVMFFDRLSAQKVLNAMSVRVGRSNVVPMRYRHAQINRKFSIRWLDVERTREESRERNKNSEIW